MRHSAAADLLNAPHILLVDDNRNGLIVRKALLQEIGYQVETAENGEQALALVGKATFDVIVTDYRMPRMNGAELIEKLRRSDPQARIIMLSGFVDALALCEQSTGADIVLAKSSNEPAHLVRSIKRLLNRPKTRKPPASQKAPAAAKTKAVVR